MQTVNNAPFTLDEYDYLYKHYAELGAAECAERLNRTVGSIENHAYKLGISSKSKFKQYELDYASTYGRALGTAMIFLLPDRTSTEVEELIRCKNTYPPRS